MLPYTVSKYLPFIPAKSCGAPEKLGIVISVHAGSTDIPLFRMVVLIPSGVRPRKSYGVIEPRVEAHMLAHAGGFFHRLETLFATDCSTFGLLS
jgi:hypothetical protein